MDRNQLADLAIFRVVAEELNFTRAAARLSTSQSAVSQSIRRLEASLGVRLLARTTRSMAITLAGRRLMETLTPAFGMIDTTLGDLGQMRDSVAGTIRITSTMHAAQTVLWPVVTQLVDDYPEVKVEISADGTLTDIVSQHFDAGVRLGQQVEKDMIALRISPDLRLIVVGAPSYFADHPPPVTPHDLTRHNCINVRLPSSGVLYSWEFHRDGRDLRVRVDGSLIVNNTALMLRAALEARGLAFVFEDTAKDYLQRGELVAVLDDWCPYFSGYHLYYPSRRQHSPAFLLLLERLRRAASA